MSAHSQTPWYQHPADMSRIVSADELAVATVFDADDGAFIVRACNAHDGLVEALERCISELQDELPDDPEASAWTLAVAETVARTRAALTKVAG